MSQESFQVNDVVAGVPGDFLVPRVGIFYPVPGHSQGTVVKVKGDWITVDWGNKGDSKYYADHGAHELYKVAK